MFLPLEMGVSLTLNIFACKSSYVWYLQLIVNLMQQIYYRAWIGNFCIKRVKLTACSNSDRIETNRLIDPGERICNSDWLKKYMNLHCCFWPVTERRRKSWDFCFLICCLQLLIKHSKRPRVFVWNLELQARWKRESSKATEGSSPIYVYISNWA